MMIGKEILKLQDKMYLVNRKISENQQIDIQWWKYKTKSDKAFRSQGFYYFVEDVQDVEPIEDGQLQLEFPD